MILILIYKIKNIFSDTFSVLSLKVLGMLCGSVFYNFSQFVLIFILSKIGTLEMIGQLGTALAISAPVSMFFSFRLYFIQIADAENKYKFMDYFVIRIIMCFFIFTVVAAILFWCNYEKQMFFIIMAVTVSKIFENISEIYYGYAQKHHLISFIAKSRFLKGLLTPIIFGCTLWITNSMIAACLSMAFSWFLILLMYDEKIYTRSIIKDIKRFFTLFNHRKKKIYSLLKVAFPLGIMSLLVSLSTNIPRYFIEFYQGVETLGVYTVISYIAISSFLVMGPLFHSYVPILAGHYSRRNNDEFKKLFFSLLFFAVFTASALISFVFLFGEKLLLLFFGYSIAINYLAFMFIIIAAGLNIIALCLLYTLTSLSSFSVQPILYFFDVVIMSICCFYFVPWFGLIGASYASCIVALFHIIVMTTLLAFVFFRMGEGKRLLEPKGSLYE